MVAVFQPKRKGGGLSKEIGVLHKIYELIYGFQNTDFIRVPQGFLVDNTLMHNTGFFGVKTSALSRAMLFSDYTVANIQ